MTDLVAQHYPVALLAPLEDSGALSPTALTLPTDISLERYEAVGTLLGRMDSAVKWWVGDWLLTGEVLFGEAAYQAIEALNVSEETRQRYVSVAQRVPAPRRMAELSWTHHKHVASMEPDDQTEWLTSAADAGWSATRLYEQLRDHRNDPEITPAQRLREAAQWVLRSATPGLDGQTLVDTQALDALEEALA